jgi:hypothetical protein
VLTRRRAPVVTHSVVGNKTLDAAVFAWGERQRSAIYPDASTRHSYVNYAQGSETVEQLYGYDLGNVVFIIFSATNGISPGSKDGVSKS